MARQISSLHPRSKRSTSTTWSPVSAGAFASICLSVALLSSTWGVSAQEITARGAGCARIPPSAPQNLQALPQDEKVVLTWEAPANGACVDKYDVKVTDLTAQDTRSWIEQDESGQEETDKLRLVIENLKNGREYLFEVMAVSDAPPAPRDRNSRDCSRQRRTVSVSTLMRFFFTGQMSSDNDCDREEPPSQLESKAATARVYSTPRPKRSPPAPTVWPVEEEYAPPGPPSSLIALGHNEKITLRWDPPANDGGCPIEEYSVNVKPVNPTTRSALLPSWDVNSREHEVVIEELDNCEYYQLTVRAKNCDGWGASMDVVGTPIPTREPTVASPLFLGMWCPV